MTPEARERIWAALALEHRKVSNYDVGDARHVLHPNATLVGSTHAGFLWSAARVVIAMLEEAS